MPILDTVVLFAAADPRDKRHSKSIAYMSNLTQEEYLVGGFSVIEFDIVLKSRGYSFNERMDRLALMIRDFPETATKVSLITPSTLFFVARLEKDYKIDYFDAGVASEALQRDSKVVSTDKAFDKIPGLTRLW